MTTILVSIDGAPPRHIALPRELSESEKRRLMVAVCGFVRTLQVWMDGDEANNQAGTLEGLQGPPGAGGIEAPSPLQFPERG